jgi:hypothetical protein
MIDVTPNTTIENVSPYKDAETIIKEVYKNPDEFVPPPKRDE